MLERRIDVLADKLGLITGWTIQEADIMIVNGYSLQGTFPILPVFRMKRLFLLRSLTFLLLNSIFLQKVLLRFQQRLH